MELRSPARSTSSGADATSVKEDRSGGSMELSPMLGASARNFRDSKKTPSPLVMRLSLGEIKFDGSPNKVGARNQAPGLYGMSGVLPPVPSDHARNNEQLLAQRRQRMEGAPSVKHARQVTLEDEEEAYALFKRQMGGSSSSHLPSLSVESPNGNRTQSSPSTRRWPVGPVIRSPSDNAHRLSITAGNTRPGPPATSVTVVNWKERRPQHNSRRFFVNRSNSRNMSPSQSMASSSPPPLRSNSKLSFEVPSSPSTPPPHDSESPSSPSKVSVPLIQFNFRVRSSPTDVALPTRRSAEESPYQSSRANASSLYKGDYAYCNPNFYCDYATTLSHGVEAQSARTADSLPYWALPPLPIGTSETPRVTCSTPSVESTSVVDTARNDERVAAWRAARMQPSFRGRAVLNTSAGRTNVDVAAAEVDWNERFQSLLELPCATPQDANARADAISQLQCEFRDAVLPIVETIILERHCDKRTIPLEALGGVAGGDKYMCGQIIVKFASSRRMVELYGSHDNAMKSVVNELKGLKGIASCDVPLLHYPLGMLVSFLGHYVWATAKIPIGPDTLRSGSRDGGHTVVEAKDEGAKAILEAIGTSLNLKWHRVGKNLVPICGPVDLEIHCGLDGRYYALDTARVYPPDPNAHHAGATTYNFHLYRSLRHELMLEWPEALSSDAFSPFGRDSKAEHDDEVMAASLSITKHRIPNLIGELDRSFRSLTLRDSMHVSQLLHSRGINVRYTAVLLDGYLKQCHTTATRPLQPLVTHLAAELVARCFASATRGDLLGIHSSLDASITPYHALMVDRFNALLGATGPRVEALWHRISIIAAEKYAAPLQLRRAIEKLACRKTMALANISSDWFHRILWIRASQLMGVEWDASLAKDDTLLSRLGSVPVEGAQDIFSVPLIASVVPIVKMFHMNAERLAHTLVAQGRLGEAEMRYLAELKVRRSVLGERPSIVPLLHSISELYAMPAWGPGRPRLKDALVHSESAVRVFQHLLDSHTEEGRTHTDASALVLDPSSQDERSSPATPDPKDGMPLIFWEGYAASLANHGRLLREAGRVREALDVAGTAIQFYGLHGVDNRRLIASLHSSQSLNWQRLGHLVEAYESAQASVAVAEAMHLTMASEYSAGRFAESLCLQAEAAHRLGFRKEAHACSTKGMRLLGLDWCNLEALCSARSSAAAISDASSLAPSTAPLLPSLAAAMVFSTWVEVRLDMAVFESDEKAVDLEALVQLLKVAQEAFADGFGTHNYELLKSIVLEARVVRLQGHYHQGMRLLEDAVLHAEYLYGARSHQEALVHATMVEFSFLPMVEQPIEVVHDKDDIAGGGSSSGRFKIAEAHLAQAAAILLSSGGETTPLYAYVSTVQADLVRCRPDVTNAIDISESYTKAYAAVTMLEELQLHNAMPYIYAMNVASMLRIRLQRNARVIPDLLRVLASSDRFMLVADSDSYTQESILYCQHHGRRDAPAATCKIVLSHDGYVRKLAGKLQLVSLLMAHDELLNAAMVVKEVNRLMRDLFPPHLPWSEERRMFLPLLSLTSEEILRRTGSVAGPVTDIALALGRIVAEENAKQDTFAEAEHQRTQDEQRQAAADLFRTRQDRLSSQAKQIGTYFGTRAFQNGFALLHSLLDAYQELYPDGATRAMAHSITTHNEIVRHLLFARRCMQEPSGRRHAATEEALLQAEEHAVDVLRCPVAIEDPSSFDGWVEDESQGSVDDMKRSQVEESFSMFRFGEDGPQSSSHMTTGNGVVQS